MEEKINLVIENERNEFLANISNKLKRFKNNNYENCMKSEFEEMGKRTNKFLC